MVQALLDRDAVDEINSTPDEVLKAYRFMLLARILDDKFASLYRMGKIHGGVFLGRGQEALSAASGLSLSQGDVFAPLIRDGAGRLAFGEPLLDSIRTYLGSALGPMRGRDGNIHRGRPSEGLLPMISHLGAMISVVNGVLFAKRMQGKQGAVGLACVGDGATSTGSFHEALNQAAVEKLPLVIVVANNHYAYSTPNGRQFACRSLIDKAPGYGIESLQVDGTDLRACLFTLRRAVQNARSGKGPQFVYAELLRLCGHGEHDDATYVDPALRSAACGRDCIKIAEEQLLQMGAVNEHDFSAVRAELVHLVEEAVARVQREVGPNPYAEDWCALSCRHLSEGHTSSAM